MANVNCSSRTTALPTLSKPFLTSPGTRPSFIHQTSSPFHPISNGHSEVMAGVATKILKKAKESNQYPYLLILEYRNSPLPDCNLSPAQVLLSRRTWSVVPITDNFLKPQAIDPKDVQKHIHVFRFKSLHLGLSPDNVIRYGQNSQITGRHLFFWSSEPKYPFLHCNHLYASTEMFGFFSL